MLRSRRTVRGAIPVLLAGLALPPAAKAQSCAPAGPPRSSDSVNVAVLLLVHAFDRERDPSVHYRQLLAEGIRQFLMIEPPFVLDAYDTRNVRGDHRTDSTRAYLAVNAAYRLTMRADGHLANVRVVGGSRSGALDRAIVRAIAALDTSGLLPPAPASLFDDGDTLAMSITVSSIAHPGAITSDGITEVWSGEITLLAFRTPLRVVTRMSRQVPGIGKPVQYPPTLRLERTAGMVRLAMVVGTDGAIELASIQALEADHIDFLRAVLDVAATLRFEPLQLDGCSVRHIVELPFTFTLH